MIMKSILGSKNGTSSALAYWPMPAGRTGEKEQRNKPLVEEGDVHRDFTEGRAIEPCTMPIRLDHGPMKADILAQCATTNDAGLARPRIHDSPAGIKTIIGNNRYQSSKAQSPWSRDVVMLPDPPSGSGLTMINHWQGPMNPNNRIVGDHTLLFPRADQPNNVSLITFKVAPEIESSYNSPYEFPRSAIDSSLNPTSSMAVDGTCVGISSTIASESPSFMPVDPAAVRIVQDFVDHIRALVIEEVRQLNQVSRSTGTPQTCIRSTQTDVTPIDKNGRLKDEFRERRRVKGEKIRYSSSMLRKMQKARDPEEKRSEEELWRKITVATRVSGTARRLDPAAKAFVPTSPGPPAQVSKPVT